MDSFAEPYTRQGDDVSIDKVREQIATLEDEHRKKGIPLSGRIIHVCHYLPITATLVRSNNGVLSPPATPPADVPLAENEPSPRTSQLLAEKQPTVWSLSPRYGHAAMISGIRSLSHTHEQLIVGWTGDIQSHIGTDKVPVDTVSEQERDGFELALKEYHPKESDPDDERDRKTKYVPVWLEDKVAHGHYDGYCKQSMWFFSCRCVSLILIIGHQSFGPYSTTSCGRMLQQNMPPRTPTTHTTNLPMLLSPGALQRFTNQGTLSGYTTTTVSLFHGMFHVHLFPAFLPTPIGLNTTLSNPLFRNHSGFRNFASET